MRSNFFCPGPHSCLTRWRLPISAHTSAWSCRDGGDGGEGRGGEGRGGEGRGGEGGGKGGDDAFV